MKATKIIVIVCVVAATVWWTACTKRTAPPAESNPAKTDTQSDVAKAVAAPEVSAGRDQPQTQPPADADNSSKTAAVPSAGAGEKSAAVGKADQAAGEIPQTALAPKQVLEAEVPAVHTAGSAGTQAAEVGAAGQLQMREALWPDGSLRQQWTVKVRPNGAEVKHGEWRSWYENGQSKLFGEYVDDVRNGLWLTWHQNGQKRGEGELFKNVRVGMWAMWDETGQQRSVANYEKGLKHGEWALWDADGSLTESGQYSRNKKHGTWTKIGPEGKVETQWNQGEQVE